MANSIRYRRRFYEENLAQMSDDTLRFVLLHEEGHIRKGSSGASIYLVLPIFPYLILLHKPFPETEGLPFIGMILIVFLVLTALLGHWAYYSLMYGEEFAADQYAAEIMRRCYGISEPEMILNDFLISLQAEERWAYKVDYKPSIVERTEKIRKI